MNLPCFVGKIGCFALFWPYFGLKVVCSTQPCLGNFGACVVIWHGVFQVRHTNSSPNRGTYRLTEACRALSGIQMIGCAIAPY
jgi:hypothetical protein